MAAGNRIPIVIGAPTDGTPYVHLDGKWTKTNDAKIVSLDEFNKIPETQLPYQALRSYINDWLLTSDYKQNDIVIKDTKVYRANANIAANTPFVSGTAGLTWSVITASGGGLEVWQANQSYDTNDVVLYDSSIWVCISGSLGAGTFIESEWAKIIAHRHVLQTYNLGGSYKQNELVVHDGRLWYCKSNILSAAATAPDEINWGSLTDEIPIVHAWDAQVTYPKGSLIMVDGYVFYAPRDIEKGVAFHTGSDGWNPLKVNSANPSITEYNILENYIKGTMVFKDTKIYYSNADIPANTLWVQGTTGTTWTEMKNGSAGEKIPAGTDVKLNSIIFAASNITIPDADLGPDDIGTWVQVVDYTGQGLLKVYLPRGLNTTESVEYSINTNYGAVKFVWAGLYWVSVSGAY